MSPRLPRPSARLATAFCSLRTTSCELRTAQPTLTFRMYFVRLIVPYLLPAFITLLKFFECHPLSDGILSVAFAAVYEMAQWFFAGVLHFLGIHLGRQHKPTTDVCEE